jgi:sugar phosphate isomerase/epimerase
MRQEFSLAYLTVPGLDPPDMVSLAARVGYDYVGLRLHPVTPNEPTHPLATDRRLLRETQGRLSHTGVAVLDVELVRLTPAFDIDDYDALLDVTAELGAKHVIAQGPDSDLARVTDHFGQLCDAANLRGLTVDMEFVTWTETPDLARTARIVRDAGRDNGGVLIDTLHFSRSNCSAALLAELPRHWFRYVQICDAPRQSPDSVDGLIYAARHDRLPLGKGELDLSGILGALPSPIPYSLEIPNLELAHSAGLEECARLALASARTFVSRARPSASRVARSTRMAHSRLH